MQGIILKLEHDFSVQKSLQGLKIQKLSSSISPLTFSKLFRDVDIKVNPRRPKPNPITKSIHDTLREDPQLFFFKSKGLLFATESCEFLDRNRVRVTLSDIDYEGIMDGGHSCFAIASYLILVLFEVKVKDWDRCKKFWIDNYEEILSRLEARKEDFNFSIPIELITPTDEDGADLDYFDHAPEICFGRNNNAELNEATKGNKVGFYDYLKDQLSGDFEVIWRAGEAGRIQSADIISFSTLSLMFLKQKGVLTNEANLNKISIYSQKGKCVDFFNAIIAGNDVSTEEKGRYVLHSKAVKSALDLTGDIVRFFDRLYIEFPNLYHRAAPGKFGRISSVDKKETRVPYNTIKDVSEYNYPPAFIYPLVSGLTSLMQFDEKKEEVSWKINPKNLDVSKLDLSQYVELIKMVSWDPQKIGKGAGFYKEAENVFEKLN
jgi:hypothetical protein